MSQGRKKSIWVGPPIQSLLDSRSKDDLNVSGTLNTAIERYLEILRRSIPYLQVNEWCLIFDALNGHFMGIGGANQLPWAMHSITDAIEMDAIDLKWSVDKAAFIQKIQEFGFHEWAVVAELTERFRDASFDPETSYGEVLEMLIQGLSNVGQAKSFYPQD